MEDFERHGKHVFISGSSAENAIETSIEYIKQKASSDARSKAFEDCTNYWKKAVEEVVNSDVPNGAKVSRIRKVLSIPYDGKD